MEYLKPTVAASNVLPRSTVEFNKILGEYEEGIWIADDAFQVEFVILSSRMTLKILDFARINQINHSFQCSGGFFDPVPVV